MINIKELVDVENGTQSRRIFSDQELYQQELARIFARCWLFLTHESLIPNFGDFVVTKMGEDEVVVWRQRDGSIKVFLNVCTHRGMKLCMAEAGNARGFSCGYHGWAFGTTGSLDSVPVEEAYGPNFDKCKLGLREVSKVESHRGFIFGCMDAAAPTLKDYLGDFAWYMDLWADVPGGATLLGPPSRSIVRTNWKTPTENFIGDSLHVGWTHAPSFVAAVGAPVPQKYFAEDKTSIQATTRYGHGLGIFNMFGAAMVVGTCPELEERVASRKAQLEKEKGERIGTLYMGQWDASIFPNCSFLYGANIFKVWHPLGPDKIEVMTWAIAENNMSDDLKRRLRATTHRLFGTAGLLESDDIDNFEYGASANRGYITRQGRIDLTMGMGQEREDPELPGVTGPYVGELPQRGFYRFYADCLSTNNWQELEKVTVTWKEDILRRTAGQKKG